MLILGLNTSDNGYLSVSLSENDNVLGTFNKETKKTEQTVNLIYELFEKLSLTPEKLATIGVITGPGGYTGIRAGMSVAKTISQLLDIPVIGFNKADAFIYSYYLSDKSNSYICPLIDVKRDEVYTCIGKVENSKIVYILEPCVITLDKVSEILNESDKNITVLSSELPNFNIDFTGQKNNIVFNYDFKIDSPEICNITYKQVIQGINTKYNDIYPIYAREAI